MRTSLGSILFLFFINANIFAQDQISLINPQVGQQNCYLHFHGTDYCSTDGFENITYYNDTLILTIDSVLTTGDFIVSEALSGGSDGTIWSLTTADDNVLHTFHFENDSLSILSDPTTTSLWSWLGSYSLDPIDLNDYSENQTFIKGWKTGNSCTPNSSGFAIDQNILGKSYNHLNIQIDDSAFDFDGEGYTYIYSLEHGIIAYSSVSPWTMYGVGWHLIPNCNGCASINIDLGEDIELGPSESAEFSVEGNFETYEWQDGNTSNSYLFDANNNSPGNYEISLSVTDISGCSWTDSVNVEVLLVDDLDKFEDEKTIEIYPTLLQSTSQLHIQQNWSTTKKIEVAIYNQLGELVFEREINSSQQYIDKLNLPSGIYFVRFNHRDYYYPAKKIIIL